MASLVTDWGQDFFANAFLGKATTIPSTYYVALLTQTPDASVTGSALAEPPSADGYARVSVTNNATNFGPSSAGIVTNNIVISFGVATNDWPLAVTDYAFCDASTNGNVYFSGSLRIPRMIYNGDLVSFGVGLLTVSISGITQIIVGT